MARGMVKFNIDMRVKCIELASRGHTIDDVSDLVGISKMTLYRWFKKDSKFEDSFRKAFSIAIGEMIENNLIKLANGVTRSEVSEEYLDTNRVDSNGEPVIVKIKSKRTIDPPSLKANISLAKKYHKELSEKYEDGETNNTTNILSINTSDMNLRDLQELTKSSPLGDIIETSSKTLDDIENYEG